MVTTGKNDMKKQRQGGFILSKIHQLSGRIFTRMLKDHGVNEINPAQGRILFVLWCHDGISINELAKETSLGKSTMTSMLDRLEQMGFAAISTGKIPDNGGFAYFKTDSVGGVFIELIEPPAD